MAGELRIPLNSLNLQRYSTKFPYSLTRSPRKRWRSVGLRGKLPSLIFGQKWVEGETSPFNIRPACEGRRRRSSAQLSPYHAHVRFLKEPGMRLPKFEYIEPRSLKEASKTLALDPKGSVLLAEEQTFWSG